MKEVTSEDHATKSYNTSDGLLSVRRWLSGYEKYSPAETLSKEEMTDLVVLVKKGSLEGTNALIGSLLGFLVQRARAYGAPADEMVDLLNEGVIAIIVAARRFEVERNLSFMTYAGFWITHYMGNYMMERHQIHASQRTRKMEVRISTTIRRIFQQTGEEPSNQVLADEIGLSADVISKIRVLTGSVISSHSPVGDNAVIEDLLAEDSDYDLDAELDQSRLADLVGMALDSLKPEYREVIELSMGIGCEKMSYTDIAKDRGVPRQNVHIQATRAYSKMRKYLESQGIDGKEILGIGSSPLSLVR
jgi:RNA polymerase sigma factor (sigma-70 family)